MTDASALLIEAQAAGLTFTLPEPGAITLRGAPETVAAWAPILRPHKAALLALLCEPRHLWDLTGPDGAAWRSCVSPPMTWAALLAAYPAGTEAAPVEDPDPGADLPADVVELVNGWLDALGETCPDTRREVLERARDVPAARAYYLQRARPGAPPRPDAAGRGGKP